MKEWKKLNPHVMLKAGGDSIVCTVASNTWMIGFQDQRVSNI